MRIWIELHRAVGNAAALIVGTVAIIIVLLIFDSYNRWKGKS